MSDPATLETASYATWTEDTSETINGWLVTATAGVSRRINSARAEGETTVDAETKERLDKWFSGHGLPLIVRETPLMATSTSRAIREVWGLEPIDETIVMTSPTTKSPARGVRTVSIRNSTFQGELAALNGYTSTSADTFERILARVAKKGVGVWIPGKAAGVVVRYRDVAAVFSVAVGEDHRRTGIGTRLMSATSTWASEQGVRELFVQVLGTNARAMALYEKMGFREVYRYRYLGSSPAQDSPRTRRDTDE